jgi:hypothetical protein
VTSIAHPTLAVGTDDLPDLAELATGGGPSLSIWLPTDREHPDSESRLGARWRGVRDRLTAAGTAAEVLDEAERVLQELRTEADTAAVVTDGATTVAAAVDGTDHEFARWDSLPALAPWVEWHQGSPPGVLAVVDRTGADLFATGSDLPVAVVDGESGPVIHRSAPGGWSQRRFQQRAEESWRANGSLVADELAAASHDVGARVIVMAGDVRAVREVRDQLPSELVPLVRLAAGGRGEGSTGHMEQDTRRWYQTAVAEDAVTLIRQFEDQLGAGGRAATGMAAVTERLRSAAVDTLLVHPAALTDRRLLLQRDDRALVAEHAEHLLDGDHIDAEATDALIAAAWASAAQVRVVPRLPSLVDGVGATLRFP